MPIICVALSFKDLEGKSIPDPEGYPDQIHFQSLDSVQDVTLELIMETLTMYLEDCGIWMRTDIVISWSAMDISTPFKGKPN